MKKLTGFIIILAALILGSYFWMGYQTERSVKKTVDILSSINGLYADVEQYQRGWFNSKAIVSLKLQVPERVVTSANGQTTTLAASEHAVQIPLAIAHGPFIFSDGGLRFGLGYGYTDIPLPPEFMPEFNRMFSDKSDKPMLKLSFFVNYMTTTSISAKVLPFKLYDKNGNGKFEWLGLESQTTLALNLEKVKGKFVINGLRISKDKVSANMGKFDLHYNLYESPQGLMVGHSSIDYPSVLVVANQKKVFEIDGLTLKSDAAVTSQLLNASVHAYLNRLLAQGKVFGPGKLDIALRNLDAEVMGRLKKQLQAAQTGSDAERQAAMFAMMPEIPELFNKGAEFEISTLKFQMPEGTIKGQLLIALPKEKISNVMELAQNLKGNGQLKVPASLVKQLVIQSVKQNLMKTPAIQQAMVDEMNKNQSQDSTATANDEPSAESRANEILTNLSASGLIVLQGSDYVIKFSLEGGKLLVNGKPFVPAMLNFH